MTRRTPQRASGIRAFTEHAKSQVEAVIPQIGYVPPAKRPKAQHVLILSTNADVDVKPNVQRIAHADPLGFLVSLMHGHPVQIFSIENGKERMDWVSPSLEMRMHLAKYLGDKLVPYMTRTRAADVEKPQQKSDSDDNMFERAAHGEV